MTNQLVVDHASKWFGDLVAVSDVSFTVDAGVTALLGPNGAGKSTLLRMLCGLTAPSQGSVRVLDRDPRRDLELTRGSASCPSRKGSSSASPPSSSYASRVCCTRSRIPTPLPPAALAVVELDPSDPRRLPTYSKGMRQRVKVAQALVHDPRRARPRRAADRARSARSGCT